MAVRFDADQISLGVRDLVASPGPHNLISSFPLPQRGMLGRKAQNDVQKSKNRRFGIFHSEYHIRQSFPFRKHTIHIQGRIDGVYQLPNRIEIEEIKSVILTASEFKNLHIEQYPHYIDQVLLYAYLIQNEGEGIEVRPHLVLVNLINEKSRTFKIEYSRQQVETKIFKRIEEILETYHKDQQEQDAFRKKVTALSFSLPEKRPQQQSFMENWQHCLQNGQHFMVSAPTGTGKTAAALFPAIQYALSNGKRIFFLTSKTTQQKIVMETIRPLIKNGLELKTLFIRASEKMCANDIYFCHEAYCPYAKDYHERLLSSNILNELAQEFMILPDDVIGKAKQETLCPFEVLLELAAYADLIVGDYNYVFDPAVFLRRLFNRKDVSDWILIIDEAHNLYTRGMQYLSPQIKRSTVQILVQLYKKKRLQIFRELTRSLQQVDGLLNELQLEGETHYQSQQYFTTDLNRVDWEDALAGFEAAFMKYLIHKVKNKQVIMHDPVEEMYYTLRRFVQVARIEGRAFVPYYNAADGGNLHIKCCDPSEYLGNKIAGFYAVAAMSATLDPIQFYKDVLGFDQSRTKTLQLDSPFPAKNRKILIIPTISTRYKDRHKYYAKLAEIIRGIIALRRGNYLVFFPSFEFMQNVNLFLGNIASTKIMQKPSMPESERDQVLELLKSSDESHLLMAVMGGIFSEGIDYPGNTAIGVIVISPALPAVNYERELLKNYYDEKNELGMEYAYIYPGMNKVIQSVGRLIRSAQDKGIVVLVGDRFCDEKYNGLMPDYWFDIKQKIIVTDQYKKEIKSFWK